jgi:hypothetical protein
MNTRNLDTLRDWIKQHVALTDSDRDALKGLLLAVEKDYGDEAWARMHDECDKENAALKEIIRHCYAHSDYLNCGKDQMQAGMRNLFARVISEP